MCNRLYAAKMCSHEGKLYYSAPVEIATLPDDVNLASMDGWMDGLALKVAYCVVNDNEGAAVLQNQVTFANSIDHRIAYNAYDMADSQQVPVTVTVANNGFQPVERIDITMGGETSTHEVMLMPQQTVELTANCPVTEGFDGTIAYDVTDGQGVDVWYTLDGIRLQGEPVLRGVYVNQRGEKRVVK